ncbi:MAG TPA: hypothetical protein PLS69_06680, partial [Terricaulis sp.]|nr:hypothetical protein [Terricaulis sp.]
LLGLRGDRAARREAVAAFRAALEVHTRDIAPVHWAMVQNNLGGALSLLGARENVAMLDEAIVVLSAALEVRTRGAMPAAWAETQFNSALAHRFYVLRGGRSHLPAAREAARAALSGFEEVGNTYKATEARRLIADLERRR